MSDARHVLDTVLSSDWSVNLRDVQLLTDLVEVGAILDEDLSTIAKKMISMLPTCDAEISEAMFYLLYQVALTLSYRFSDYDALAAKMQDMRKEEILYALSILSFSGNLKYRELIASYLNHADSEIRSDARECLEDLGLSSSRCAPQ